MKCRKIKPEIYVRKARSSDREAVFKFCEKTWSWGDYVPRVWDRWLMEENGRLFVATIDGVPVGISHLSLDKPSEVWLSGARTDPDYRRVGVATAITERCLEYAKNKGAKVVRLVTESDNVAAQALLRKLGFQPVTEFVEMVTENVTEEENRNSRWAEKNETMATWNFLQTSETHRKTTGLYTVLYHWFSLEKQDLKQYVEKRRAIVHETENCKVNGLTLVDDATAREWQENTVQTCYIDGDHDATLDMIKFLKNHCRISGVKKIYGFACNHKPITSALEKLGFEPSDSTEIVYEKKIQPA